MKWTALPEASKACHELLDVVARKAVGSSINVSRLFYSVSHVEVYVTVLSEL